MESFKFIFENLGENKVTHPIEVNEFEEGKAPSTPRSPTPRPLKEPPKASSFLEMMFLWKNPEMSLLSSSR